MPQTTDEILRDGFPNDAGLILYLVTQRSDPDLQQPISEPDQTSRPPTLYFQFFGELFLSDCQRYAFGLGNPT